MSLKILIRKNAYFDSVTLMKISGEVSEMPFIQDVLVGMATELNINLLKNMNLYSKDHESLTPNDLIIAIKADNDNALECAVVKIDELFSKKGEKNQKSSLKKFERVDEVADLHEGYNMAVISVPGIYAKREAENALNNNMNVFLFSDNVTVEEEVQIKDLALEKGLLLMGPDCGTAIINGVPLGFANRVKRGNIGIVGASGTGLQHVTTLIDALGGGISQAIGTGGRDLSLKVAGRTMLSALDALKDDDDTKVIVIISKPPNQKVSQMVFEKARTINKKVVLCLMGAEKIDDLDKNIIQCFNIEETACCAVSLALEREVKYEEPEGSREIIGCFKEKRTKDQKYVRGIFGGGTLCDEAMVTFRRANVPIYSNIPLNDDEALLDVEKSKGNTFLDMGDDYFTKGKPHPMIEPSLRNKRIIEEATDKNVAAILVDVELGHGSHADPVGVLLKAVDTANELLEKENRKILWIASFIATKNDPQGYDSSIKRLLDAGFVVYESNVRAAKLAASLASY